MLELVIGSLLMTAMFIGFIRYTRLREKTYALVSPYWYSVIVGPTVEELLFRGLPMYLGGDSWYIGAPISILFGLVHSFDSSGKFNYKDIHWLPCTIAGFWLWYVAAEYGLIFAILAHIANNDLTIWYAKRLFKKEQKLEIHNSG